MFTSAEREELRRRLLEAAKRDVRLTGAAITGSAARDGEDQWSDVDLAFGVSPRARMDEVLADWTARMYRDHGALDDVDVTVGSWVYRVFLLDSTLQVDLAFAPAAEYGARAPTFRLVFGESVTLPKAQPVSAKELVGLAWLYGLHVRSCIERGRLWQAELMLANMREQVFKLACKRHDLPLSEGRGIDRLPEDVKKPLEGALVGSLDARSLRKAHARALDALRREAALVDAALAQRLEPALRELVP